MKIRLSPDIPGWTKLPPEETPQLPNAPLPEGYIDTAYRTPTGECIIIRGNPNTPEEEIQRRTNRAAEILFGAIERAKARKELENKQKDE